MKRCLALAVSMLLCSPLTLAAAADDTLEKMFASGVDSLRSGAFEQAVSQFEAMAERGLVHPDVSYNRAAAYVGRALSERARPGDLGRAAAALSETRLLRTGDVEAEAALERVREELARRRAGRRGEPMTPETSLSRAIVDLSSEDVWGGLALAGSMVLTLGLMSVLWVRRASTRVPALLAIGIGTALVVVSGTLTALSRHFRITESIAVVVVPEARLLDERAVPLTGSSAGAIPEGAEVRVSEQRAALVKLDWGRTGGWVLRNQLRLLSRP